MGDMVRELCLVSVLCSVACNLAPDGAAKKIMAICCSVIMMLLIAEPLEEIDMEEYASSLVLYRELENKMSMDAQEMQTRLNRLVIEDEYKTYIMDKAKEKQIDIYKVSMELEWNTAGFWVPESIILWSDETMDSCSYFSAILSGELGISEDKILWQS